MAKLDREQLKHIVAEKAMGYLEGIFDKSDLAMVREAASDVTRWVLLSEGTVEDVLANLIDGTERVEVLDSEPSGTERMPTSWRSRSSFSQSCARRLCVSLCSIMPAPARRL